MKRKKKLINGAALVALLIFVMYKDYKAKVQKRKLDDLVHKQEEVLLVYEEWLALAMEGKKLSEYLIKNHFKTVGIYGLGRLGKHLYYDLKSSDVHIQCVIDNKYSESKKNFDEIPCYSVDDQIPNVDLYIVTVPAEAHQIKKALFSKTNSAVESIQEIMSVCR